MTSRAKVQRASDQILQTSRKSRKLIPNLGLRTSLELNNKLSPRRIEDIDVEEVEREQSFPKSSEYNEDFVDVVFGLHGGCVHCIPVAAAFAIQVAHCVAHFIVVGD